MSQREQGQDQLSGSFSQRFKDQESEPAEQPAGETAPRKRGRPRNEVQRKTVSFFLPLQLAERLNEAYYQWNAGLSKETQISRAGFREIVLEKGLEYIQDNREDE